MRSGRTTAVWMGLAFCAALVVAVIVIAIKGDDSQGTAAALVATARLSFILFWLAYAGSAMAALFGKTFQPLKQRTRELGLAFAAAHLVHIGLVAWLCWIGAAPSSRTFAFFGFALFWTYLLAFFSFARPRRSLHPKVWWLLRFVGLNTIMYAFAVDFAKHPLSGSVKHVAEYAPFLILATLGPVLRLAASMPRPGPTRFSQMSRRAG